MRKKAVKKTATSRKPGNPILEALRKSFGDSFVGTLAQDRAAVREVLPTGLSVLDNEVLGIGGLPIGRMIEVYGTESSGKTTLVGHLIAGAQEVGAETALVDSERSFLKARLEMVGGNPRRVIHNIPLSFEEAVEMVTMCITKNDGRRPILVVWDSLASQIDDQTFEDAMSDSEEKRRKAKVGVEARIMSKYTKIWTRTLMDARAVLVVINQTRHKVGTRGYGDPLTTPGGDSLKFHASMRLRMKYIGKIDDSGRGQKTEITCVKNKLAVPWKRANYRVYYSGGFDDDWAVRELAVDRKIAKSAGGVITLGAHKWKASQTAEMADALREHLWPS